jgi:HD-GYP domain-containing protein (c-di-GMP phosphodiesterase class II)
MMFDIGKSQIPTAILNKEGALTPEEKEIFRTHTTLGYNILKSTNGITLSAMNAALMHHERLDGSGYPNGFKREELSEITRIVAIADMYDALTSNRAQKKSRTHLEAITLMTNAVGTHLDATLVYKFIECLGVYPPGCAVEMLNGSIAIVIEVNHQFRLKPKVILILDEEKNFMLNEKPLDLSESPVDRFGEPYIIKSIVRAEDWNINLINYYQQEILEKGLAKMR